MRLETSKGFVAFGELLLRMTAPGAELLLQTPVLNVFTGGAEANVAVAMAKLGHDSRFVGVIPDNALGWAARDDLRRHGVETRWVETSEGRMGIYYLSNGAIRRASEILYDRADSAQALAPVDRIGWDGPLAECGWFHVSGITPALSENAAEATYRALQAARAAGLVTSFDCNYRSKLWQAWSGDGAAHLRRLIGCADVLFGDHRDIELVLGWKDDGGPPEGRLDRAIAAAFDAFPDLSRIACTQRLQHSVDHHELSGCLFARDGKSFVPAVTLMPIVDRIGGGDAFAAGIIHGLMNGWADQKALEFAMAAAAIKHTIPGDFNLASEAEITRLMGDASLDVRR